MTSQPVESVVMNILREFVEDWGLDEFELSRETALKADIGFDSSDTMQLFAAIQEHYAGFTITFQDLVVQDDHFVEDLKVGEVIAFVGQSLQASLNSAKEAEVA